jgi:hypothetical protein
MVVAVRFVMIVAIRNVVNYLLFLCKIFKESKLYRLFEILINKYC